MPTPNITVLLVQQIIAEQFPNWADLPIKPVQFSGHDNRTFHLGHEMLVRLPSTDEYAPAVLKEQVWLPKLAPNFSIPIPHPLAMGKPCQNYPFNWSIYQWIDGENADTLHDKDLDQFACDLAQFLHELHNIDTTDGLIATDRGTNPKLYDWQTRPSIEKVKHLINADAATTIWEKAINSHFTGKPVWIHGDLAVGNILVKNHRLAAIIDFSGIAVGDPACDLVIAWTFLNKESRKTFRSHMNLDAGTWARAAGWALWKALITLIDIQDKKSATALQQLRIIHEIIADQI